MWPTASVVRKIIGYNMLIQNSNLEVKPLMKLLRAAAIGRVQVVRALYEMISDTVDEVCMSVWSFHFPTATVGANYSGSLKLIRTSRSKGRNCWVPPFRFVSLTTSTEARAEMRNTLFELSVMWLYHVAGYILFAKGCYHILLRAENVFLQAQHSGPVELEVTSTTFSPPVPLTELYWLRNVYIWRLLLLLPVIWIPE